MAGRIRGTRRYHARATTAAVLAVSAAAVSAVAVSGCSHQDTAHGASAAKTTQAAEALPPQPSLPATPPMPSASAAATTAPSAAGQVKGGVHTGDLRTFFLPVPQHALPYGDPDGDRLDPVDVGDTTDHAVAVARLKRYHYAEGFGRTYSLPGDHLTVTIRLARFGSPALAAGYFGRLHYTGSAIRPLTLHEPFPVTAQQTVPGAPYRELFATTCQGDVQMMVRVVSTTNAMPARTQLTSLLEAQYQRLRTGH